MIINGYDSAEMRFNETLIVPKDAIIKFVDLPRMPGCYIATVNAIEKIYIYDSEKTRIEKELGGN